MDKRDERAVILYLAKKGLSPKEVKEDMDSVLGETSPSYSTIKYWHRQFKCGRTSTTSEPSTGRPQELDMEQVAARVVELVRDDPRVSQQRMAATLHISKATIQRTLAEHLQMRKLCTRWMPKILTVPQLHDRVQCSRENLSLCKQSPSRFLASIVTGDESWVHHYDPLSQREAREWTKIGQKPSARPRQQRSAGKILLSVFWDDTGVLLTDYLQLGHVVTGNYYAQLVSKLRDAIKEKRRGMLTAGVRLLHDNAPAHTSYVAVAAIHAAGFETVNHPPYSPDLAPSDFHLFAQLKKHLRGYAFDSDEEVTDCVNCYLDSQPPSFYKSGIAALPERWQRVIDAQGSYID